MKAWGGTAEQASGAKINRLLLMTDGYGFYTPHFYPTLPGRDYIPTDVLNPLMPYRDRITIPGNLGHLNGHASQKYVATGSPQSAAFSDSVDQVAARSLSQTTPVDSLLLSTRTQATGGSYRNRVPVSMMYDPEEIFDSLFTKGDVKARRRRLKRRQSMLDLCLQEAKSLSNSVSRADRRRLDEYLNSIRETEQLIQKERRFLEAPLINPGYSRDDFVSAVDEGSGGDPYFTYLASQLRFIELAFRFDLTRVAYLWEHGRMHGATHHGHRPGPIATLTKYATDTTTSIATVLKQFSTTKMPSGETLLDECLFVWTAALGSAAAHKGANIPAILAGGRLPHHGGYVHFDTEQKLTSLYLTVLQQLGIETDRFNDAGRPLNLKG